MGKSLTLLILLAVGVSSYFATLFAQSAASNIHKLYIRSLQRDVVMIRNSKGSGATGFLIKGKSGNSVIMTNSHVCGLQENGKVFVQYRNDMYVQSVIKEYALNDLCAIEAPNTVKGNFSTAHWVTLGEEVSAIGYPFLEPLSVTNGEFSGIMSIEISVKANPEPNECVGPTYKIIDLKDTLYDVLFGVHSMCTRDLETMTSSVSIAPGNSGSPVVNIYGHVVGVMFAGRETGGRSYAVPLEHLKAFLQEL